ncbi:MAG: hypothetical protein ACW98Y_12940 [Candidatus Thorarchaeota archaeon]
MPNYEWNRFMDNFFDDSYMIWQSGNDYKFSVICRLNSSWSDYHSTFSAMLAESESEDYLLMV